MKVVVVGDGVFGSFAALYLARSALDVVLVGDSSTAASLSGGISSLALKRLLDVELVARSAHVLRLAYGNQLRESGSLTLGGLARKAEENLRTLNLPFETLSPAQIRGRWPGLNPKGDGLWVSQDFYGDGERATVWAKGGALEAGARLLRGRAKLSTEPLAVLVGKERLAPDALLVCAGSSSRKLLAQAGLPLPLSPYRCQAGFLRMDGVGIPIVHNSDCGLYFRPETGGLLFGDGTTLEPEEPDRYERGADERLTVGAAGRLVGLFPGAAKGAFVKGWAGVVAGTPDGGPLLGQYPGVRGLYVLAGGNGFGLMRGPQLGRLAARAVLEGGTDEHALDLARFADCMDAPFTPRPGFGG